MRIGSVFGVAQQALPYGGGVTFYLPTLDGVAQAVIWDNLLFCTIVVMFFSGAWMLAVGEGYTTCVS